jgi:aspartate/tyrosine/aromatic aminotransferase
MLQNGRISLAGLSERTVPYLADSIHKVVTESSKL